MKLYARKSIAALGTAMALAVTPVAVPSMAPVAVAAVSAVNFNKRLGQVKDSVESLQTLKNAAAEKIEAVKKDVSGNSEAEYKINEAKTQLTIAEGQITSAANTFETINAQDEDTRVTEGNYGSLDSAIDSLNQAKTALSRVDTALNEARSIVKKAKESKFECPGAENYDKNADKVKDGSSTSGFKSFFTSSGNRVVYKNGKKECVSNREYYTEMLTKLVAVLGTVLTLITTATKISEVVMKAAPGAPAAN